MKPARILDCHAHIIDPVRFPLSGDQGYKPWPEETGTCEQYCAVLDRHGVDSALLVQLSGYGADNSILVDAMQRYPRRFKAIGVVHDDVGDAELEALALAGVVGLRFNLVSYDRDALSRPESRQLLQRMKTLGLFAQVFAHDEQWPEIAATMRAVGVRVLVDHFGIRDLAGGTRQAGFQAVLALARDGLAAIKLSAPFRISSVSDYSDLDRIVEELLKQVGPGSLMWGSDWPFTSLTQRPTYADTMAPWSRWLASAEEREQVLWRTPARLFGFEDR
jgi:predicted TIM-barrel fold metal-dependent hydrolase